MTSADQIVRSAKKCLPWGRPHMTASVPRMAGTAYRATPGLVASSATSSAASSEMKRQIYTYGHQKPVSLARFRKDRHASG